MVVITRGAQRNVIPFKGRLHGQRQLRDACTGNAVPWYTLLACAQLASLLWDNNGERASGTVLQVGRHIATRRALGYSNSL